jgi:RND family efflux transporter MFP subunit
LPFLPAAVAGALPQGPARDQAAPAPAQSAERPSQPAIESAPEPASGFISQAVRLLTVPVPDAQKIRVRVSRPVQRVITDSVDLAGHFDSVTSVTVRPRVSGTLVEVKCMPGLKVVRGDLLFQIDPRTYKAEQDKAHAELMLATARWEAKKAEPPTDTRAAEIKAAEASLLVAQKVLERARLNMEFTSLTSPINGTIIGSVAEPGNVAVADTTTLATIVSTDPMYVYFDVAQDVVLKLNRLRIEGKIKVGPGKGLPIQVGLQDEHDLPRAAMLDSVNGSIDPATDTARWRARLANPDGLILPGMFASVRLPVGEPHRALLVPENAARVGWSYVDVVAEDGVLSKRTVTLGNQYGGMREVKDGLSANEWVVVGVEQAKSTVGLDQSKLMRNLPYGSKVDVEKVPMPDEGSSRTDDRAAAKLFIGFIEGPVSVIVGGRRTNRTRRRGESHNAAIHSRHPLMALRVSMARLLYGVLKSAGSRGIPKIREIRHRPPRRGR